MISGVSNDRVVAIILSGGGRHDDGKFATEFADQRGTKYEFDVRPRNKHFNIVLALMANKRHVTNETTFEHAHRNMLT